MFLNAIWLVIFMTNNDVGFGFGLMDIILMLGTCFFMMMKSTRVKATWMELLCMRLMFSIYTGWVTAATIVNATFYLKAVGLKDPNAGWAESTWSCIILYVAFVIYSLVSFMERNPIYGGVYIWVVVAIRSLQVDYPDIQTNGFVVLIMTIVMVSLINVLCTYEKMNGKATRGIWM